MMTNKNEWFWKSAENDQGKIRVYGIHYDFEKSKQHNKIDYFRDLFNEPYLSLRPHIPIGDKIVIENQIIDYNWLSDLLNKRTSWKHGIVTERKTIHEFEVELRNCRIYSSRSPYHITTINPYFKVLFVECTILMFAPWQDPKLEIINE